jgi:FAD/FMN-containing dehydrogenase
MGGQQFLSDGICIDMRSIAEVRRFDQQNGLIEADAGIQWPQLIKTYRDQQRNSSRQWGIAQKQTGADTFTLGGSLSSNIHGRGLTMKPLISNVESFTLLDGSGKRIQCSRTENQELFRLAIGGYGLFGIINTVTLRLVPRRKLRRVVEIIDRGDLTQRLSADWRRSADRRRNEAAKRRLVRSSAAGLY